jgi:glycosyltransferase involved in cell wall biosynthesis
MIIHVITGLGIGGAEAMLVQVAGALNARGIPQHVVCLVGRGENAKRLEDQGVQVSSLDMHGFYNSLFALFKLCLIVARVRPSTIQGWMYHGNLMAALAHRLSPGQAHRKLYWGLRASNMDDLRYGWINKLCARISHWPNIVIANSQAGALSHEKIGYRPRRIEIIANGIDTRRFHPDNVLRTKMRAELGIASNAVVAIHVARVDPMKDHAIFLAAMKNKSSVVGLLVGAGTQNLTVPPNVHALGVRNDVERLYPAADIVVSSSAFGEGFSNVIAEGMSAGLRPVVTDVGDARVIVGDTGRLVPPGDVAALAEAIDAEAVASPEERSSRGLRARARIQENFSIAKAIDAFANLYAAQISEGA